MAKPDTDDGWFKKATELELAISYANFSKTGKVLLSYTLIQIYGKGKRPKLAYLAQKDLAQRMGQKLTAITRAIRELVMSGVLEEVSKDMYRFDKDYEKWTAWSRSEDRSNKPRLTREEVQDCKNIPEFAELFRIKGERDFSEPPGSVPVNHLVQSSEPPGSVPVNHLVQLPL